MIEDLYRKFDNHCIVYFFMIGFALGLNNPEEGSAFYCGLAMATIGGLAWYSLKAILITGSTVANWDRDHPGEPMIKAGGLTAYDEEKCRQTGAAVAEAIRKSRQADDSK